MAQLKARVARTNTAICKQPIHLIGVEFSKASRNILALDVEQA